jgi:AcrR family transcriptional regulator
MAGKRIDRGAPRHRLAYAATRERILTTAADVFQQGYHATSLDDVAVRLGVTKPAIYHYFPSKEHLLSELYDRVVSLSVARLKAIARTDSPPVEKLEAMLRAHIGLVAEQLPLFTVFFREEKNLPEAYRRQVLPKQRAYGRMMVDVYREGVRAGAFRDVDPVVATSALLAMGNWLYHWYRPDGRLSPKEIADIMVTLAMAGCLREPARPPRRSR